MPYLMPKLFIKAKENIKEIVYCTDASEFYTKSLECSLREALSSLRSTNNEGELDVAIQQLEQLSGNLYTILNNNVREVSEGWGVLCHGDLWINNLMFKYDNAQVKSVKLIDLQTVRYSSPVIDILHFIYSSTEKDLRDNHLDQLLEDYSISLLIHLGKIIRSTETMIHLENRFSLENIRKQFRKHILYGLGVSMWLLPAVTFHPDKIPDLDSVQLSDFSNSTQEKAMTLMQTPEYHSRMKHLILEFQSKGYLQDVKKFL